MKGTVRVLYLNSIYSPELSLPLMAGCPLCHPLQTSPARLFLPSMNGGWAACLPAGVYLLGVVAVTNAKSTPGPLGDENRSSDPDVNRWEQNRFESVV